MTPDISIYSRDFIKLACAARDAAQKLAIAVGYTDSDIGIPPVIIVRGEAIRIESGVVAGIGSQPVVELNLTHAAQILGAEAEKTTVIAPDSPPSLTPVADSRPEPTPAPKRKRRTKAQIEADEAEARKNAEPVATAEDRGVTETASGTPACPIDPTHDLEYCEGACEEVQRMAAEEPEPEPADDPPFVKGEPGPTPASAAFYMTAEELEQPAGGDNPWRLILHSDQPGYPVVRGRHPSLAAAFKAAGPTRDECTNKGWREVAPIKAVPLDPPF
jgi:hypothetical protein